MILIWLIQWSLGLFWVGIGLNWYEAKIQRNLLDKHVVSILQSMVSDDSFRGSPCRINEPLKYSALRTLMLCVHIFFLLSEVHETT